MAEIAWNLGMQSSRIWSYKCIQLGMNKWVNVCTYPNKELNKYINKWTNIQINN